MSKTSLRAGFHYEIEPTGDAELPWLVTLVSAKRTTSYRTAGTLIHVQERVAKVLARMNKAVRIADLSKL